MTRKTPTKSRNLKKKSPAGSISFSRRLGPPLHHQVYLVLRDQIMSNRYRGGDALPSEDELAALYAVSRITIRTALKHLHNDELIVRRQGIGTFIRDQLPTVPMHVALRDQRAHIEELARFTTIKLLEYDYGAAPAPIAQWFGAGAEETFLKVVRVRSASRPVLLLTTYTPEHIGRLATESDVRREAHYALLAKAGVRLASSEHVISAVLADPVTSARLAVDVGSPLLRMVFFDLNEHGKPVRYLEVLAPSSEFELHMQITGDEPTR
jgi:GntR family transcriptional regulator